MLLISESDRLHGIVSWWGWANAFLSLSSEHNFSFIWTHDIFAQLNAIKLNFLVPTLCVVRGPSGASFWVIMIEVFSTIIRVAATIEHFHRDVISFGLFARCLNYSLPSLEESPLIILASLNFGA